MSIREAAAPVHYELRLFTVKSIPFPVQTIVLMKGY